MKIAIASGKGGTGKTTVSIALASALEESVQLLDCDVEEPNCHLFLESGDDRSTLPVEVKVPVVDEDKCNACGKCARICQFNAIVAFETKAVVVLRALSQLWRMRVGMPDGCIDGEGSQDWRDRSCDNR